MNDHYLTQIYQTHRAHVSDKWSLYLDIYEEILRPLRERVRNVLEIGVQNGGSLELWAQYFEQAQTIVGCDIDPACADIEFSDPRITVAVGDASVSSTRNQVLGIAENLDFIIDDGSHKSGDIIRTLVNFFPHLREGGIYLIEDLHCSYWQSHQGGLHTRLSAMNFLKYLADVINREHWSRDDDITQYLRPLCDFYGIEVSTEFVATLHAVEFRNSIALLRKRPAAANRLGARVVVGETAKVEPAVLGKALTCSAPSANTTVAKNPALTSTRAAVGEMKAAIKAGDSSLQAPSPLFAQLLAMLAEIQGFLEEQPIGAKEWAIVQELLAERALAHPAVTRALQHEKSEGISLASERTALLGKLDAARLQAEQLEHATNRLQRQIDQLEQANRTQEVELQSCSRRISALHNQINSLINSRSWRYTRFLRQLSNRFKKGDNNR